MNSSTTEDPFALVYLQQVPVTLVAESANKSPLVTGILAISVEIEKVSTDAPEDRRLRLDLAVNDTTTHCPVFAAELSVAQITKDVKQVDWTNLPAVLSLSSSALVVTSATVTKTPLVLPKQVESFVNLLQSAIHNATNDSEFQYQIAFQQGVPNSAESSTIRLTLKERLPSGMVRLLWTINLKGVPNVTKSTTTDASDSMFAFTLRLLQRQQDLVDQLSKSQETFALLERDRNGWKETATSLENTWEVEKAQLVRNFCDLYSAKQRAHDESAAAAQHALRGEIATLKQELETAKSSSQSVASKKRPKKALPDVLQDVPDDVDRETFDAETVALLASGQPLPLKASSSAASNHHDPASTTTATGKSALSGKRRNPLTGVTEYFDIDSALADVLADEVTSTAAPPQPPFKKTRVSRAAAASSSSSAAKYRDDDSDLETPAVAAEKPARAKRPKAAVGPNKVTKTKKVTEKMQVDKDDDDDDDQYVDKDLDAEIMADLLSLQKAPL
jgi:hypothetical protein